MVQKSQKLKDPAHIWDEVSKDAYSLYIVDLDHNHVQLNRLLDNPVVDTHTRFNRENREMETVLIKKHSEPYSVINLHDYSIDSVKDLKGLPKSMPNLELFDMRYVKFQSLKGFPKNLTKLNRFNMWYSEIQSLEPLPQELPSLKSFFITKCPITSLKGMPKALPNLESLTLSGMSITTLEYFPQILPNLEKLSIGSMNLTSLRFFPQNWPNLKSLSLGNKLTSIKGIPRKLPTVKELKIYGNITSLEHLPEIVAPKGCALHFNPKSLRTLSGIKYKPFLKRIALHNRQNEFVRLHPKGHKLIKEYNKYTPESEPIHDPESNTYIAGHFEINDDKYDELVNFYAKTPLELAQQYITIISQDHTSTPSQKLLTKDELERLAWEADHEIRQLLESNLPADDPIVKSINARFSVKLNGKFKIKL